MLDWAKISPLGGFASQYCSDVVWTAIAHHVLELLKQHNHPYYI